MFESPPAVRLRDRLLLSTRGRRFHQLSRRTDDGPERRGDDGDRSSRGGNSRRSGVRRTSSGSSRRSRVRPSACRRPTSLGRGAA